MTACKLMPFKSGDKVVPGTRAVLAQSHTTGHSY